MTKPLTFPNRPPSYPLHWLLAPNRALRPGWWRAQMDIRSGAEPKADSEEPCIYDRSTTALPDQSAQS